MNTSFPQLPARLGDYTLTHHLGSHALSDLYLATQIHVERAVIIEALRPGCTPEETALFLATARARAAARLPGLGQVFESMSTDGIWYTTLERPKGKSLSQMAAAGERLKSARHACAVIIAAAGMYDAAASQGIAAAGLAADSIFTKGEELITFLSPVLPEPSQESMLRQQQAALADALEPVLPINVPGQNRVATLVSWLREGYEGQFLEWASISSTADLICRQLAPVLDKSCLDSGAKVSISAIKRQAQRKRRKALRLLGVGSVAAIGVAAIGGLGLLFAPGQRAAASPIHGKYADCHAGKGYARMLARPVTIAEYRRFLSAVEEWQLSAPPKFSRINKDIPESCHGHTPLEWEAQLHAANRGKKWHGEKLSEDSPVRGVSYWDALACARFMKGSVPEAELLQAVRAKAAAPRCIEEWTSSVSSLCPLYSQGHVILPASGSPSPSLEPDPAARSIRRGFRVLIPDKKDPS